MIWFSATVRIACMIEHEGLSLYMDCIHIFQADDWTPAFHRAVELGHSHEEQYKNSEGQLVIWKLAGITTLDRFDAGLRDGLEVCSNPIFPSEKEWLPFDHVFEIKQSDPTQSTPAAPWADSLTSDLAGDASPEERTSTARDRFQQRAFYFAGRNYCQAFSQAEKVGWAAKVVASFYSGASPIEEIDQTLALAGQPARWLEGAELVQKVLAKILGTTSNPDTERTISLLYLTEKLAKLIYNASIPTNPFDGDIAEKLAEQVGQDAEVLTRARLLVADLLFPLSN